MNPLRLALRTLLFGSPRARVATLMIAASLCALDLLAGRLAGERSRLEYQAVVGERLGHLALVARDGGQLTEARAAQAKRVAENVRGVALVVPQLDLVGVAASGRRSALFNGTGMPAAAGAELPGKLAPGQGDGIAVSDGQARALGIGHGSTVTITAIAPDARPAPVTARVVDVYSTRGLNANARNVLVPLAMAQDLLDKPVVQRLAVFLSTPANVEGRRAALAEAMRRAGIEVEVRSWRDLSPSYARGDWAFSLQFASAAAVVLVFVIALVAATLSLGAHERRRELSLLRALGMRRRAVFGLMVAEAVWMAAVGAALSFAGSGLVAWTVNRAALPFASQPAFARPPVLVELDPDRLFATMLALLAAALLAACIPAFKAARADLARGLTLGGQAGW